MNQDLDSLEEKLKKPKKPDAKGHKTSGRSVFKIQEIIKKKAIPQSKKPDDEEKNEP